MIKNYNFYITRGSEGPATPNGPELSGPAHQVRRKRHGSRAHAFSARPMFPFKPTAVRRIDISSTMIMRLAVVPVLKANAGHVVIPFEFLNGRFDDDFVTLHLPMRLGIAYKGTGARRGANSAIITAESAAYRPWTRSLNHSRNMFRSTGLTRCSSKPACRAATRSSTLA